MDNGEEGLGAVGGEGRQDLIPQLLRRYEEEGLPHRGGLASRATGLGPEGPPSAKVPMGPFCAGRNILQMVNFG